MTHLWSSIFGYCCAMGGRNTLTVWVHAFAVSAPSYVLGLLSSRCFGSSPLALAPFLCEGSLAWDLGSLLRWFPAPSAWRAGMWGRAGTGRAGLSAGVTAESSGSLVCAGWVRTRGSCFTAAFCEVLQHPVAGGRRGSGRGVLHLHFADFFSR